MNPSITTSTLTLLDQSGQKPNAALDQVLPKGQSVQAKVIQSAPEPSTPNVYRIKLEIANSLLELKLGQPLIKNSQIQISRGQDSRINVELPQVAKPSNSSQDQNRPLTNETSTTKSNVPTPSIPNKNAVETTRQRTNNEALLAQKTPAPRQTAEIKQASAVKQSSTIKESANLANNNSISQKGTPQAQSINQQQSSAQIKTFQIPVQVLNNLPLIKQSLPPNSSVSVQVMQTADNQVPAPTTKTPNKTADTGTNQQLTGKSAFIQKALSSESGNRPTIQLSDGAAFQPRAGSQAKTIQIQLTPQPSANSAQEQAKPNLQVSLQTTQNLPNIQQAQLIRDNQNQFSLRWSETSLNPDKTNVQSNLRSASQIPQTQETIQLKAQIRAPLTTQQSQNIDTSLRQHLPQQIPVAEGLQQLVSLTQAIPANEPTAKQLNQVMQSLLQLFGVRPNTTEASQAVKQNINMGGLFTENQMAQKQPPTNDFKQFLGKLNKLAEQLPSQHPQKDAILKTVDKLQSRITVNQAQHLQQQAAQQSGQNRGERVESNERFFQLDLPVRYQNYLENVDIRLQQRTQRNPFDEWESVWKVRLNFDLQELGSVTADISLNDQQQTISAAFICTDEDTRALLTEKTSEFRSQMQQLGLDVPSLTCRQGEAIANEAAPIQKSLIDVRT